MWSDGWATLRFLPSSLKTGIVAVLSLVLLELFVVVLLNGGHFVYTLDDPYIHLRLAENIWQGHYGVNPGESSSPASSILWPLLMAPFARTPLGIYIPLLLNIMATVGTVFLYERILRLSLRDVDDSLRERILPVFLLLLVVGTNLISLIFMGMEHALQVFLSTGIVYGMIRESETGNVPRSLLWGIVIAPTIRYENLALSGAAILYLLVRGHRKEAELTFAVMLLPLIGFSLFLMRIGLAPLPASVTLKTNLVAKPFYVLLATNLIGAISIKRGMLLILFLLIFITILFLARDARRRAFAGAMGGAILLHLLIGKFGWYDRYEIYIWSASLLSALYLLRNKIALDLNHRPFRPLVLVSVTATAIVTYFYIFDLFTLPVASNNVYEQQYQMHRFVHDFYRKPIAVNDIGYVGYDNPSYVLDLFGLSSVDALQRRLSHSDPLWMDNICKKHQVHAALIYDSWFPQIPASWRKIGVLHLSRRPIVAGGDQVSFYALDDATVLEMRPELLRFVHTLPKGVTLSPQ